MVRISLAEGSVLVLCNYEHTEVINYFRVIELTPGKSVGVIDHAGRVFKGEWGKDLWVHPDLMIGFEADTSFKCSKFGYKVYVLISVNNRCRVHNPYHLYKNHQDLFCKLPSEVWDGV